MSASLLEEVPWVLRHARLHATDPEPRRQRVSPVLSVAGPRTEVSSIVSPPSGPDLPSLHRSRTTSGCERDRQWRSCLGWWLELPDVLRPAPVP